jgi:starvation-inducible DNA-binding protein
MATKTDDSIRAAFAAISGPQREKNHRVLQPVLTDLIAFALTTKQLHWNVHGPHFRSIHLHLDEIYASVQIAIDAVAERLTACGHSPSGSLGYVAKQAELKDVPEGFLKDDEVLLLGGQRLHELIGLIRDRMEDIEDPDPVTADLLHQIVADLEKHHWMIQASRS